MAQLASLVVPMGALPQPDRSWLDGLASMGGDIIGELGARKSFGGLADRIATPASVTPQQSGGFLSGLVGGGRQSQPQTMAAPVGKVDRGQFSTVAPRLINDLSRDFGLSPEQAAGVVGQLGHESAGFATLQEVNPLVEGSRGGYGYAQWTGPRRKAFEAWSAENGLDPTSYDANYGFLAHELKNTPEGSVLDTVRSAPDAMAAGRAFTDGFLRPGIPGYDSRDNWTRRALAYAGQPQASGAVDAVNALAEGGRDTSAAYVDPAVSAPNSYAADPSAPSRAPMQVADAGGGLIAQGVTPVERGGVDPALIQFMLRDPNLRETGLKLWAANVQGQKASEPWQFVNLPDGTLARANQQTGAVERLGNFAKPQDPRGLVNAGDGRLYDPNNREWIVAPDSGEPDFRRATPEEAAQYGASGGQIGPDGRFYPINPPSGLSVTTNPDGSTSVIQGPGAGTKFTESQSKDNVFSTRARGALPTADQYADYLADYGNALLDRDPTGLVRGNFQNPDYQVARTAADEFLQAILRKDTGAAITEQEQELYGRTYFPVPGDGPEVRAYKKEARQRAVAAIEAGMSPAQIVAQERALAKTAGLDLGSGKKRPQGAPAVGSVEDGYRFKGGDPADPSSWEQVN